MLKRVSMRNIAEAAGVSVATVSHILNDKNLNFCSESTRHKVRSMAAELGYRSTIGYQLMHHIPTRTVGIIVASRVMMQEEHNRELILLLLSEFEHLGYVSFCHILSKEGDSAAKIRAFTSRGVEHFVFIGSPPQYESVIAEIDRIGVSGIFTREVVERFVVPDVVAGMTELFGYMISRCGENFKLLCHEEWIHTPHNNRVTALQKLFPKRSREELIARFIFPIPEIRSDGDYVENSFCTGYNGTAELLKKFPKLAGIAYLNDLLGWGGGTLLLEEKHRAFRGLVLIGCNYERVIRHFPLPFSTLQFDLETMVPLLAAGALNNESIKIFVPPIVHIVK